MTDEELRKVYESEAGPNRQHIGSGHCTWTESHRDFARRVALIAVEEERERIARQIDAIAGNYKDFDGTMRQGAGRIAAYVRSFSGGKMTDKELRLIYLKACGTSGIHPETAPLRAVFRAGARAQREMEPTPEMIQAWHDRMIEGADYIDRNSIEYALYAESYRAMQRVAPLVGGEK